MKQDEDLVVALLNLISLEKYAADKVLLLDVVRNIKENLARKFNDIYKKTLEEAEEILCDAEKELEQGDKNAAYALFGDVYAKLCN